MGSNQRPTFEFQNQISPRYIEPLLIQLQSDRWYDMSQLKKMLRANGIPVEGSKIVEKNTIAWSLTGLGQTRIERSGRYVNRLFALTTFGKQMIDIYSTNHELFYDLMHFIFNSAWNRSHDLRMARFWLYATVSDILWAEAPSQMDSFGLTNRLQIESRQKFAVFEPAFPERAVRAVFPWLQALTPPFLSKRESKNYLCSERRSYCTPQLFHLATDLIHNADGLAYGTSMAIDDRHMDAVSRICLLDTASFWQMAELTKMTIRGFEIRRGQWGTSIALDGPPAWIIIPVSPGQQTWEVSGSNKGESE